MQMKTTEVETFLILRSNFLTVNETCENYENSDFFSYRKEWNNVKKFWKLLFNDNSFRNVDSNFYHQKLETNHETW